MKNDFIFDAEIAPKELQIRRTKNYDQFKTITGNRKIKMGHVNNLVKAIHKNNLLPQFVGVATKDGYLIDGQHRKDAAKANDLWFYFTIIPEIVDDIIVAIVNSIQLKWTPQNYIDFYAEHGNEQYIWLKELYQEHKMNPTSIIGLFTGRTQTKQLRNGTMTLFTTEEDKAYELALLDGYLELKDSFSKQIWVDQDFILALRTIFQFVNSKELLTAIERWGRVIVNQDHAKDYLRVFEEIVNKGRHEKNHYRFF